MLTLTVLQGPDRGKVFQLPDDEPQLIGRSSEALPLSDNTISRRHAELTPDDGRWWIRDLNSQNGTYVNGARISERTVLRAGDQVRTGATVLLYGAADPGQQPEFVRFLDAAQMDAAVERTIPSNEDSLILAIPEPRAAAQDHLRVIYQLTTLTAQTIDQQQLLEAVMELVFNVFKPERGFIVLATEGYRGDPRPVVVRHRTRAGAGGGDAPAGGKGGGNDGASGGPEPPIDVSRTILNHALRRGEGVLSTNAMTDPRFAAGDSVQRMHIRSAVCSPVRFRDRTYGAIYIDSSLANYTFTGEQLALMNAIGQHTGLALANAELYRQKLQAERLAAIGETVASLSHSIKNILQGLRGGADLVEMGIRKEDLKITRGGWDILKRNLDRIVSLAMNMLAFSRQRQVEIELTPLEPILQDCAQLLAGQCSAKGVAMMVDLDPEMPPLPMDASLIHQALMNLMTNAVQAVEQGRGAVTVRATYHAAGSRGQNSPAVAEIQVIDNGPGIAEHMHKAIFEPFHTSKGARGTGLGLAVTKRIVEEHRGHIHLESDEGIGTVFRIVLSADAGAAMDPAATAAAQHGPFGEGV